jgi:hypothetical protein
MDKDWNMICQDELDGPQRIAVAHTMALAMMPGNEPIIAGTVRREKSGTVWANFGGPKWFRVEDVRPRPEGGYAGAEVVFDMQGRPQGNLAGMLLLHWERGKWNARLVDTGWKLESEIKWEG